MSHYADRNATSCPCGRKGVAGRKTRPFRTDAFEYDIVHEDPPAIHRVSVWWDPFARRYLRERIDR